MKFIKNNSMIAMISEILGKHGDRPSDFVEVSFAALVSNQKFSFSQSDQQGQYGGTENVPLGDDLGDHSHDVLAVCLRALRHNSEVRGTGGSSSSSSEVPSLHARPRSDNEIAVPGRDCGGGSSSCISLESKCWEIVTQTCASPSPRDFYMLASDALLGLLREEGEQGEEQEEDDDDNISANCDQSDNKESGRYNVVDIDHGDAQFRFLARCLRLCAQRLSVHFTFAGLEVLKTYLQSTVRSAMSRKGCCVNINEILDHLMEMLRLVDSASAAAGGGGGKESVPSSKTADEAVAIRYSVVGVAWWLLDLLLRSAQADGSSTNSSRSTRYNTNSSSPNSNGALSWVFEAATLVATRAEDDLLPTAGIDAETVMLHAYRARDYVTRLNASATACSAAYRERCGGMMSEYRVSQSDARLDVLTRGVAELHAHIPCTKAAESIESEHAPWDEVNADVIAELRGVLEDALDVQYSADGDASPPRSVLSLLGRRLTITSRSSVSPKSSLSSSSLSIWPGVVSHENLHWSIGGCAAFALFILTERSELPLVYSSEYLWELACPNVYMCLKTYPGLYENAAVQMDSDDARCNDGDDKDNTCISTADNTSAIVAPSRWWHLGARAFVAAFRNPSKYMYIYCTSGSSSSNMTPLHQSQFLDSYALQDLKLWRCSAISISSSISSSSSSSSSSDTMLSRPRLLPMVGKSHDALSLLQLLTSVMVRCNDPSLMKSCVFSLRYLMDAMEFPHRLLLIRRVILDCPYPQVSGALVDYVKDRFQCGLRHLRSIDRSGGGAYNSDSIPSGNVPVPARARDAVVAAMKAHFTIAEAFAFASSSSAGSGESSMDVVRRSAAEPASADCCVLVAYQDALMICDGDLALADALCCVSVPIIARYVVASVLSHYSHQSSKSSESTPATVPLRNLKNLQDGVDDLVAVSALLFAIQCNAERLQSVLRDVNVATTPYGGSLLSQATVVPWMQAAVIAIDEVRRAVTARARASGSNHSSVDIFMFMANRLV